MNTGRTHGAENLTLDIGSGVVLESQQHQDLKALPIGTTGVEIYFQDIDKTAIFSVIKQPSIYREGLFGLTVHGKIVPITPHIHREHPNMKVLEFTGFEGQTEPEPSETAGVKKSNKKKIYLALGGALVLGLTAMGFLMKKGNQSQEKGADSSPSILQHYSLSHPIPGVMLYDTIRIVAGQSLEQISGEYLISVKQLHELNPNISQYIVDGAINTDISLMVPRVQAIFRLEAAQSWNDIGARYGIDPTILMYVNGSNIKIGDTVFIPTAEQAEDIKHYIWGENIESVLYQLNSASTLTNIALYADIPEHLHDLFFEMNLASPNDKTPGAIHSKDQVLPIGTKFLKPIIRDFSQEISTSTTQGSPRYDTHITGKEDTMESIIALFKHLGLTEDDFQRLNPDIPLNSTLHDGMEIKLRDITEVLKQVSTIVELPKNVIDFVAEREMGTKKTGYLRGGIQQKKTIQVEQTVRDKKTKKKKTVLIDKEVLSFPNDGITLEPGCDLGQVDEDILRSALEGVLAPEIIERIISLSRVAQAYRKEKNKDGKLLHTHALKEIPAGSPEKGGFDDLIDFKMTQEQTEKVKHNIMQAYWDKFLKKHIPNIDIEGFATDEIRAVLLSIVYHRGGYFLPKFPEALQLMKEGKWSDPKVKSVIESGKAGTDGRTREEVELFEAGLLKLSTLNP